MLSQLENHISLNICDPANKLLCCIKCQNLIEVFKAFAAICLFLFFFATDNNKNPYFSYVDAGTRRFHSLPVDEWVEVSGF